ncbi:MAG TPA: sensor histidine kinase, partial [Rhizobiales bacterium]|nr:sensor histidine kinase [Hyphomicrobiales bacterium]
NLRNQIAEASRRTAELNEQYLRRISADLHDGPAQLIGHAALRLHSLQPPGSSDEKKREVHSISENLSDAMNDIRNICKGLSLPATKDKPLAEIVEDVIRAHRKRTSSKVSTDIGKLPDDVPEHIKICTYRFIQEGLNNAWLHAGGKDQHVACHIAGDELAVAVTNSLSDDHQQKAPGRRGGLGLAGLKGRVETLGGQFSFEKNAENGVCLKMLINIAGDPADV